MSFAAIFSLFGQEKITSLWSYINTEWWCCVPEVVGMRQISAVYFSHIIDPVFVDMHSRSIRSTLCVKKTAPFYFCNNFVKPSYILIIFGVRYSNKFGTKWYQICQSFLNIIFIMPCEIQHVYVCHMFQMSTSGHNSCPNLNHHQSTASWMIIYLSIRHCVSLLDLACIGCWQIHSCSIAKILWSTGLKSDMLRSHMFGAMIVWRLATNSLTVLCTCCAVKLKWVLCYRLRKIWNMLQIEDLLRYRPAKTLSKYSLVWQSYCKNKMQQFFDSHGTTCLKGQSSALWKPFCFFSFINFPLSMPFTSVITKEIIYNLRISFHQLSVYHVDLINLLTYFSSTYEWLWCIHIIMCAEAVDFNKLTYLHLKICNTAKQAEWTLTEGSAWSLVTPLSVARSICLVKGAKQMSTSR